MPDVAWLIAFIGLGALLGRVQTAARDKGLVDLPSLVIQKTTDPVAIPMARGFRNISEFGTGLLKARSLSLENERLKAQSVSFAAYADRVEFLSEQIAQLRTELGLPSHQRHRIPVDVLGFSQDEGYLLDAGSEAGIRADLPVVNGDGLVGIVRTVSKGECRVAPITAYGVKVGGVDASRQPPEDGLITGTGSSSLTMQMWNPKAPVDSGDIILTSGQSKNIPSGLIIGRVITVEDDQDYGTRRLSIDPAVNLGLVHQVEVLN